MKLRDIIDLILGITIFALILTTIHFCGRCKEECQPVIIRSDTTIVERTDTICYYRQAVPMILPIKSEVHDTIIKVDTIEKAVPKVTKEYKDSTFQLQISGGYFADLDYIKVFQKKEYVTIRDTEVKEKKPIVSITGGIGLSVTPKGEIYPTLSVIFGVPIKNWYKK